jgi:hypothetical protein
MISFVLSTRNDGYGGTYKDFNTTMRRLQLTLDSIYELKFPQYEIIIVEWSPVEGMSRIQDEINANEFTRIVTVPAEAVRRIGTEVEKPIPFYEYIAKHIGILKSRYDILCICNPDNIFPTEYFVPAVVFANHGHFVRAFRREIATENLELSSVEILEKVHADQMPIEFESPNAGGDFGMIKKELYLNAGGYRLCHGNWDVDNEFERRIKKTTPIVYNYIHYHIAHEFSNMEAPNRPVGVAEQYHLFSEGLIQSIVDSAIG